MHDCPLQFVPPPDFWHEPFTQTFIPLHFAPAFCHWPLESHCWGCDTAHWVEPGEQAPVQLPLVQRYGHAAALCHVPVASQVCGVRPTHCAIPGEQTPMHVPPLHTYAHGAPLSCQTPPLQVCG